MVEIATAALVGLAGIVGTLIGATLTERMRREGTRREHLLTHRLSVYAELLTVGARLVDNARNWSATPLEDLRQTDDDELDRLVGRVKVVASHTVFTEFQNMARNVLDFHRLRELEVQPHHQQLRQEGTAGDDRSLRQRMALSDKAEAIAESFAVLEAAIRIETGGEA